MTSTKRTITQRQGDAGNQLIDGRLMRPGDTRGRGLSANQSVDFTGNQSNEGIHGESRTGHPGQSIAGCREERNCMYIASWLSFNVDGEINGVMARRSKKSLV